MLCAANDKDCSRMHSTCTTQIYQWRSLQSIELTFGLLVCLLPEVKWT